MPDALFLGIIFSFILGSILGSFINVIIYRLPQGISIITPRSFCPYCKVAIPWYHNIPIVTWIFFFITKRGKNSCCDTPIPIQYLYIEIFSGILGTCLYGSYVLGFLGNSPAFIGLFSFWCFLSIAISVIDVRYYIIPNILTYTSLVLGLLTHASQSIFYQDISFIVQAILSGGGLFLSLCLLRGAFNTLLKKESFGLGDIKLLTVAGICFGWFPALFGLFAASFIACLWVLPLLLLKYWNREKPIPLGPFLCIGIAGVVLLKLHLPY
jgi:leader peptidase (prepilin peptidase)/N-methyltransferase